MTKNNKKKKYSISEKRHIRACLLIVAMLLTVTAGCSRKPSEPEVNPTAAPTGEATPEPTAKPAEAATPEPTDAPTSAPDTGTAFTPSGIGGRVTFTGTTAEISKAQVGDTVRFGSYEQDNDKDNGSEAIEWLVLDKQDGKLLLLSKDALDAKPYNEEFKDVTWETCTLRSWLNDTFYSTAFSTAEQGLIATARVKNEDNPKYGTEGGNGFWWLRSAGYLSTYTAYVYDNGCVERFGYTVSLDDNVVRPAFWLNPES